MSKTNNHYPRQFELEASGFKSNLKKIFKGIEKAWKKFLNTAVNLAAPFIETAVGAKTKNSKVGQATTNILKSLSGGRFLPTTDQRGNRLRISVMEFHFKKNFFNE